MDLTLTGRAYAGKLTGLLDGFDETIRSVRAAGQRPFRVLCTPGFAARWLVPRLGRLSFGDRIRLRVSVDAPSTDFSTNDSDLAIQWADEQVHGVKTERLMEPTRYPVISPALRDRKNVRTPENLLHLRLLHD